MGRLVGLFAAVVAVVALPVLPARADPPFIITLTGGSAFTGGGTGIALDLAPAGITGNTGLNLVGWSMRLDDRAHAPYPFGLVWSDFANPPATLNLAVRDDPFQAMFFSFNPGSGQTVSGLIRFRGHVRLLQRAAGVFNHPHNLQLQNASTDYTGFQGLEGTDVVTWDSERAIRFSLSTMTGGADQFAVITSTPESPTWAMLITGFGLTGLRLRRRRARPVPA